MRKLYRAEREKMGVACREWIVANYDSKLVFETYWKPILAKFEREFCKDGRRTIDSK